MSGYRPQKTRTCFLLMTFLSASVFEGQSKQAIRWTALSTAAMGITGDVKTTDSTMAIGTKRLTLNLIHTLGNEDIRNAAKLFSLKPDERVFGGLYSTHFAATTKLQSGNTLCGKSSVSWVLEVRDGKDLYVAYFSGTDEPNLAPEVLNNSRDLCGAFWYEKTVQ
jgi:hypothetical protein